MMNQTLGENLPNTKSTKLHQHIGTLEKPFNRQTQILRLFLIIASPPEWRSTKMISSGIRMAFTVVWNPAFYTNDPKLFHLHDRNEISYRVWDNFNRDENCGENIALNRWGLSDSLACVLTWHAEPMVTPMPVEQIRPVTLRILKHVEFWDTMSGAMLKIT